MKVEDETFPDNKSLKARLSLLLGEEGGRLRIVERDPDITRASFPSEVVTCERSDGSRLRLFCKYGATNFRNHDRHRGGIYHEARVYRDLLQEIQLPLPGYVGLIEYEGEKIGLAIEEVAGALRVNEAPYPTAVLKASEWIGKFHRTVSDVNRKDKIDFINNNIEDKLLNTVKKAEIVCRKSKNEYYKFKKSVSIFSRLFDECLRERKDIIHGEYYPSNILYKDGRVYPIDWESATIGSGLIDLAMLTENWPEEDVKRCLRTYTRSRWEEPLTDSIEREFRAAQMYVIFRWLGDNCMSEDFRVPYIRKLSSLVEGNDLI